MAAGSDNPLRQAMINMMYLVLLALLALNVSAEVLNAFHVVHTGIKKSNASLETKNLSSMQRFEDLMNNNKALTKPHYNRAKEVQDITNDLDAYITQLKDELIKKSGGYLMKEGDTTDHLVGAKNLDVGSRIMVEESKGDTLQSRINRVRSQLIGVLQEYNENEKTGDDIAQSVIEEIVSMKAEDPPEGPDHMNSWAAQRFQMVPVTAAVTILSKIQSDLKSTKSDILNRLLKQVTAGQRSFDRLIPIVRKEQSVVNVNEKFNAEIMIGAYSSTQDPDIYVDGRKLDDIEQGRGSFSATPSSAGDKEHDVMMLLNNPTTGSIDTFETTINYKASPSFATVSADAMNVLYTGLDNPISVSAVGYRPEQIRASINRGNLIKQETGQYVARVPEAREATITVSVNEDGGGVKSVGSKKFRIKPVPNPRPMLARQTSGSISSVKVQNAQAVIASMGQGFAFEGVKYRVSNFRLTYVPRRGNFKEARAQGPRLTDEMKRILSGPKSGDKIIIDDISAKGPDGVKRLPTAITLTVK